MKGYPKYLNTKADYLYVAANFPKAMWKQDFEDLLASESDWFVTGEVATRAAGVEDTYHKVEEVTDQTDGAPVFVQYEWKSNPEAKIYRVGFSVGEVRGLLGITPD